MANIASLLKEEITRLTRRELRSETAKLKQASAQYRSDIAALKRRVATLEQQLSRLGKTITKTTEAKAAPNEASKIRFVAKGFRSLRQRLGLSAAEIGILLDASAPSIYNWEAGKSSPRKPQLVRIAFLRGMGKREVSAILEKLAG